VLFVSVCGQAASATNLGSDQDSFCRNDNQIGLLHKICVDISPGYAHFSLGRLSITTTRNDTDLRFEDGVALADLSAGAMNDIVNAYADGGSLNFPQLYILPSRNLSWKAQKIVGHLFMTRPACALLSILLYKGSIPGERRSNVLRLPPPGRRPFRGILTPPF
jgi:hypothetical protein